MTFFRLNISMLMCFLILSACLEADLQRLMEGNQRFVQEKLKHPGRTPETRKATTSGQEPFAIIMGCSDSRVPPEVIFDQGIGDLFVVRVAGNVIGPLELDSINYSALHLGSSVIVVLGHQGCGAVNAVVEGESQDIKAVAALIEPAVKEARKGQPPNLLETAIKDNAIRMKDYLLKTPEIRKLVDAGKIEVYAGYYKSKTGAVEILK